ncbi:hypothetical protein [Trinickia mobilis]|uniref:hypothetical protein n=1 Tax=Trinickia mobilis TaxID=2816356 RepID=UPI001A8C8B49|nr:hypothetical protein [Trinickia mobilis]
MKLLFIVGTIALFPAFTGVYAARLWHQASKIDVIPTYALYGQIEPVGDASSSAADWIDGLLRASQESSNLNRKAALWTAISVGLGAITTVISAALPLFLHL